MGGLKTRRRLAGGGSLAASSMIEAIVASLVFLTVFVVSLSTITGLTLRRDEGYVLLEAERALEECAKKYGDGTRTEGTSVDTFEWGEVTATISDYGEFEKIRQMVLQARLAGSRKTIEQRILIVKKNE